MRRRHPHEHRAGFDSARGRLDGSLPTMQSAPRCRNPQPMHRFATEVFANRRTQYGTAISLSREGRKPRSFQMQVPLFAPLVPYFAKESRRARLPVAALHAELMARIEHRQWLHPRDEHAPAEHAGKFRSLRLLGSRSISSAAAGLKLMR